MLIGFALVMLFVRSTRYRYGRWTPIMFVALTPLATLALSLWVDVPLLGSVSIGGHSWHTVAAVFAISIFLILMNLRVLRETFRPTSPA